MIKKRLSIIAWVITAAIILCGTGVVRNTVVSRYDLPDPMSRVIRTARYDLPDPMSRIIRTARYDLPDPMGVIRLS